MQSSWRDLSPDRELGSRHEASMASKHREAALQAAMITRRVELFKLTYIP
jgi:hypothetical protein